MMKKTGERLVRSRPAEFLAGMLIDRLGQDSSPALEQYLLRNVYFMIFVFLTVVTRGK